MYAIFSERSTGESVFFRSLFERAIEPYYNDAGNVAERASEMKSCFLSLVALMLNGIRVFFFCFVFFPSNTTQLSGVFQLNYVLIITPLSYLQLLVTAQCYLIYLMVDGTVFHEVFKANQTDHSLLNVKTCKIYETVWSCYWQMISCIRMSVHIYNLWLFPCDMNAVLHYFNVYKVNDLKLITVGAFAPKKVSRRTLNQKKHVLSVLL